MRVRKFLATAAVAIFASTGLIACGSTDADVVNDNLTKDADNFKILRRVIFYNGITESYILEITGFCQIEPGDPNNFRVTCKVGTNPEQYKRHTLGRSDNVTYIVEQIDAHGVSSKFHKVIFKPSVIIPQPEIR